MYGMWLATSVSLWNEAILFPVLIISRKDVGELNNSNNTITNIFKFFSTFFRFDTYVGIKAKIIKKKKKDKSSPFLMVI